MWDINREIDISFFIVNVINFLIHDVYKISNNNEYTWKTYYLFRNKLYFIKNNFGFRYLIFEKFLIYLRIIKKHNHECTKLIMESIKDFNDNKVGISDTYNPSWKIKK